jgi:hypothetical protein
MGSGSSSPPSTSSVRLWLGSWSRMGISPSERNGDFDDKHTLYGQRPHSGRDYDGPHFSIFQLDAQT